MIDTMEIEKKIVKLYGGTLTIHFSNKARNRYVIQETEHAPVGVTTILQLLSKEGLMLWPMYEALDWLKKHPKDFTGAEGAYKLKSDKGKDVGSEVHRAIELFMRGEPEVPSDPMSIKAYKAFIKWFGETKPRVLATEQIIYSKELDYAGTYDALLEIDGKVILCDVKTTNASRHAPQGIYPEMFLQLGGYSLAHHEENPEQEIDDAMIIRVGKDGVIHTLRASDLGFNLHYLEETFRELVSVYKMITPLTKQIREWGKE